MKRPPTLNILMGRPWGITPLPPGKRWLREASRWRAHTSPPGERFPHLRWDPSGEVRCALGS
jgi:hypothetical protein